MGVVLRSKRDFCQECRRCSLPDFCELDDERQFKGVLQPERRRLRLRKFCSMRIAIQSKRDFCSLSVGDAASRISVSRMSREAVYRNCAA